MTPVLVWLLGLGTLGVGATAGARTLKKRNVSEQGKIERLRELQERNAAVKNLFDELGPGSRIITNPVEAWRAITGGVIDISKLPDAAREAMEQYNAARASMADAINRQGGKRQEDDEEVGSDALAMIDSLDRRFGPYMKAFLISQFGGNPNAGFGLPPQVPSGGQNQIIRARNGAWAQGQKTQKGDNPGMPAVKYMIPIFFRDHVMRALADGIDPEGRVDVLGQDVVIDDATADLNSDFSAWVATFSPSQSEIAERVRQKRIPPSPGFWDKVWSGIVGTFKEVLSLDFLVNVATMGYADLNTGSNTAGKAVTDQIKDKFGVSEVLGWVGAGIDASTGSTSMAPHPRPLTPEEKRITDWVTSQYVTVIDPLAQPNSPDKYPWILRLDLALCGAWPILDVLQGMGGVEGFERSLIFAKAPNGEPVIGGSRDLYQKPGQLAMRVLIVARRSLLGVENRYNYGAASLLSMLVNRPDVAPSRTWLEFAASEWLKDKTFSDIVETQPNQDAFGGYGGVPNTGTPKVTGIIWQYGGATGPKVNVPREGGVYSLYNMIKVQSRLNTQGIAASFALGTQQVNPIPTVPRTYTRWGIAGPVPASGENWVSNNTVDEMASDRATPEGSDIEAMSLTPQGRSRLKSMGS